MRYLLLGLIALCLVSQTGQTEQGPTTAVKDAPPPAQEQAAPAEAAKPAEQKSIPPAAPADPQFAGTALRIPVEGGTLSVMAGPGMLFEVADGGLLVTGHGAVVSLHVVQGALRARLNGLEVLTQPTGFVLGVEGKPMLMVALDASSREQAAAPVRLPFRWQPPAASSGRQLAATPPVAEQPAGVRIVDRLTDPEVLERIAGELSQRQNEPRRETLPAGP